jgi:hypothetical protein
LSSRMKKLLAVSLYSILLESMHASFLHIWALHEFKVHMRAT